MPGAGVPAGEGAIKIGSRTDECQVGKGLGKIAQVLAAAAQLLRVKTEVVGIAEHLVKEELRLFQLMGTCQAFDVPERAGDKAAFRPGLPTPSSALDII